MTKKERGIYILKKYGYLMVFGLCALILVIALIASSDGKKVTPVNPDVPANSTTTSFGLPVLTIDIVKSFSDKKLQYNATLKQYEAHLATDFACEAGANVYAIGDGTVVEVGNSYLKGNYVVINHGNNLKSLYASLSDTIAVKVGQTVTKGEVLGTVSNSAYGELNEGTHLHFEMLDNDKRIDPSGYLALENK